jgi:hypothetical protein
MAPPQAMLDGVIAPLLEPASQDACARHNKLLAPVAQAALERVLHTQGAAFSPPILFRLPVWSETHGWKPANASGWLGWRKQLAAAVTRSGLGAADGFLLHLQGLYADTVLKGRRAALLRFLQNLDQTQAAAWGGEHVNDFAPQLAAAGWLAGLDGLPRELAKALQASNGPQANWAGRCYGILELLGLVLETPLTWKAQLFDHLALPWLKRLYALNLNALALHLEARCYDHYVKQNETEAHFRATVNAWGKAAREAGKRVAAREPVMLQTSARRFALYFDNAANLLAHHEVVLNVLDAWLARFGPASQAAIYLRGKDSALSSWCEQRLLPLVSIKQDYPLTENDRPAQYSTLKRRLAEDGVGLLIWVASVPDVNFAFGLRLAPVQVYWSLKYHSLELPDADGLLTMGSVGVLEEDIGGRRWRCLPPQFSGLYDSSQETPAAILRNAFQQEGADVLYGTLAREEKLSRPEFLDTICALLQRNPRARFLWAGRELPVSFETHFKQAGIWPQTRFIGWVDTRLYAQVLDVFLDTFPFHCGLTLLQAMAAGKPAVMLRGDMSRIGFLTFFRPVLEDSPEVEPETRQCMRAVFTGREGESLLCVAGTPEEYLRLAIRLGEDALFRHACGMAAQRYINEYLDNPDQTGRVFEQHLQHWMRPVPDSLA